MNGYFRTEAPLTPAEVDEDRPLLDAFLNAIPKGVAIRYATVWVHGREWEWERITMSEE